MAARRPPNRKEMIRATAGELFLTRGYHNVSVTDVADALGVAPAALYHHYRNKQELLLHSVLDAIGEVDQLVRDADTLEQLLQALAHRVVGPRTLAVWEREARNLEGEQREQIRAREADVVNDVIPLLRQERPDLTGADGELLARALIGVMGSRAQHRLSLPRKRDELFMVHLGRTVASCRLSRAVPTPSDTSPVPPTATSGFRVSRREVVLTEAVRLFDERGYQSVTMADIGEAAGIVASGVYRHFPSKTDLLVAAVNRGGERMRAVVEEALAEADRPPLALDRLMQAHIMMGMEYRHLVGILANEADQLPEAERRSLRRFRQEYLDIWVSAAQAALPQPHDVTELKIAIHAVHSMVYFVVRSGGEQIRAGLAERLRELGMAVLLGL